MDQRLLLAIQYASNQQSVRIPFGAAGALVGSSVTEGAIVQHLAKLRARLLDAGEDVPPLLKRGGGYTPAASSSNAKKVAKPKRKAKPVGKSLSAATESDSGDDDYDTQDIKDKGKGKLMPRRRTYKASQGLLRWSRSRRRVMTRPVLDHQVGWAASDSVVPWWMTRNTGMGSD